jgi:predicted permease
LRYAWRRLSRTRGFSAAAVVSLALGIGGNTGMFTVLNAALFRPIPQARSPQELVRLYQTAADNPDARSSLSFPDYADFQQAGAGAVDLAAMGSLRLILTSHAGESELIRGEAVSRNYFDVLGVNPGIGRDFTPEDSVAGAAPVVILSHNLWRRRFAADAAVLGTTVRLNGLQATVIGVTPLGFGGTRLEMTPDLWVPISAAAVLERTSGARYAGRTTRWLHVIGRLEAGVTREQAAQQLSAAAVHLGESYPESNKGRGVVLAGAGEVRIHPNLRAAVVSVLGILMAVVGLVLLITCANLANLMLARAALRQADVNIELSLGAPRGRVIRQLLLESGMLAAAGGVLGLILAGWLTRYLVRIKLPLVDPSVLELAPDARVLLFTLTISVVTAVVVGLIPALQLTRTDLAQALKEGGAVGPGRRGMRTRGVLAVSQVAVSVVLLIGAGLFLRTLYRGQAADPGFDVSRLTLATIDPGRQGYAGRRAQALYREIAEGLNATPGVESAAFTSSAPLGFGMGETTGFADSEQRADAAGRLQLKYAVISENFFPTLGVPIVHGRGFTREDGESAPPVVVVNETAARRFWPGASPVGKRLRVGAAGRVFREVVGVVRDIRTEALWDPPAAQAYVPLRQKVETEMTLVVRAANPRAASAAIRARIGELDATLPLLRMQTMTEQIGSVLVQQRVVATVMSFFGGLAVLLAALGIYSVIAFSVSRRTREMGVRLALGGRPGHVLALLLREGTSMAAAGIVLGSGLAFGLMRLASGFLGDVSPADPLAYTAASLLMFGVACAASYLPARRAARLDPFTILRRQG